MKRLGCALLTVLAAAACSSSTSSPSSTPDATNMVSRLVGPAGGTVTSPDGTSLMIPAGALAAETTIVIESNPSAPLPSGSAVVGPTHRLGPEGQTFLQPFSLTVPYEPTRLPDSRTGAAVVIVTAAQGSESYLPLATTSLDPTHVRAEGTHFSNFVPVVPIDDGGSAVVSDDGSPSENSTDAPMDVVNVDAAHLDGANGDADNKLQDASVDVPILDGTNPNDATSEAAHNDVDAANTGVDADAAAVDAGPDASPGCNYSKNNMASSGGGGFTDLIATCEGHRYAIRCFTCPVDGGAVTCNCSRDLVATTSAQVSVCTFFSTDDAIPQILEQACGFALPIEASDAQTASD